MSRRQKARRWFHALVPESEPLLRRLARTFADGDRDMAEDLLQEGLLAVYMMEPEELRGAEDPAEEAVGRAARMMFRYRKRQRHRAPIGVPGPEVSWRMTRQIRHLAGAVDAGEGAS